MFGSAFAETVSRWLVSLGTGLWYGLSGLLRDPDTPATELTDSATACFFVNGIAAFLIAFPDNVQLFATID
jgi:hypothetical protein